MGVQELEENFGIKKIDIKEFREKGYLQELNRQFLHPLGLALEVQINEDGYESLGGIWDYREDPEGIIYDLKNSSKERIEKFETNRKFIASEFDRMADIRIPNLSFWIEPIPDGE